MPCQIKYKAYHTQSIPVFSSLVPLSLQTINTGASPPPPLRHPCLQDQEVTKIFLLHSLPTSFSVEIQSGHWIDNLFFFVDFVCWVFLLLWIIHGTGYYIVFLSVFLLPLTLKFYTFTQLDTQQRKSMATELEELLGFLSSPSPQVSSSYSFTWKKQIITNILNHNFLLLYRLQRQLLILFGD